MHSISKTGIGHDGRKPTPGCGGFTLTEVLTAMSVFSFVVLGVLACHITGLQYYQALEPKLQNAQYVRQTVSKIIEEVRSANSVQIGTGTLASFTAAGATNLQSGNALEIYPSTNTTQYVYYFWDSASQSLNRVGLNSSNAVPIATSVTNAAVFTMEDFSGTVQTNSQNNAVTSILLQITTISPKTHTPDWYQVRAKITRRNLL